MWNASPKIEKRLEKCKNCKKTDKKTTAKTKTCKAIAQKETEYWKMSKTKSKVEKTVRTVSRKVEKVKKLGWEPPTPQKRPKSVWQNGKKAAKVVSPSLVWIRFLIRASKLRLKTKNHINYSEMSKSRSGTHLKRIVFKGSAGLENNTWTSLLKPLNTASQWVKRFQLTVRGWRKTWAHKSRCVHTEAERGCWSVFSSVWRKTDKPLFPKLSGPEKFQFINVACVSSMYETPLCSPLEWLHSELRHCSGACSAHASWLALLKASSAVLHTHVTKKSQLSLETTSLWHVELQTTSS